MQASNHRPWSVSTLLRHVDDLLVGQFATVFVVAEVTGFFRAVSGHCYFQLKDSDGQVKCAMFRRAAMRLGFEPQDGQRVLVAGRLGVYGPKGELQLVVESMSLEGGVGQQYAQFLRLRERLKVEGLFAPERKRALDQMPGCVAVVTSEDAAALADVCRTMARRAPHIRVVLFPCQVQGVGAAQSIVSALQSAAGWRDSDAKGVQTVLVVRGGGAWEDLEAFNDEQVVRAIVASPVPIVCGVGHETDLTLADLAADVRAATPTAAAEVCAVALEECLDRLDTLHQRMQTVGVRWLDFSCPRVDELAARLPRCATALELLRAKASAQQQRLHAAFGKVVGSFPPKLDALAARLQQASERQRDRCVWELLNAESRLDSCNPQRVLQRGFVYLQRAGTVLASASALQPGDQVEAILSDGVVEMQVLSAKTTPFLE